MAEASPSKASCAKKLGCQAVRRPGAKQAMKITECVIVCVIVFRYFRQPAADMVLSAGRFFVTLHNSDQYPGAGRAHLISCRHRKSLLADENMLERNTSAAAAGFCALAMFFTIAPVGAGGGKVAFPADYANGVMYTSHDLADAKEFREFYITPMALDAVSKDQPLPSGTVVTLARYNVQVDAQGNPVKDGNGHFIKTDLKAFRVMEKRTGWGSEYPAGKRNGEWEYQAFLADREVDRQADLDNCFQCHRNGDSVNFMFTAAQLKSAVK